LQARKPLVDFSWPLSELDALRREAEAAAGLVIYCCGVEPGLTEIMARYLAEKMDRVDELHIKCGGIPAEPTPPLGYKIVYGGNRLPLYDTDPFCVEDGKLKQVPRYSGVEAVMFSSVGELEAWHEGFMPWLLEISALKNLQHGTQKTVRWPGYAAKATVLKELGLLGEKPVTVDGVPVAPKHVVDVVLLPHVKMEPTDRDITVVRVEVIGEKDGRACRWKIELVDRYDETTGLHSMARVTAFPASIVARMIARGELKATGLLTPEKVIAGRLFSRLVEELAAHDVRFTLDTGAGARPLM
jgi:lysine 6-dehydrogenase